MTTPHAPNLLGEHHPDTPRTPERTRVQRALRVLRTTAIVAVVAFVVLAWTTRSSDPNIVTSLRESTTVRSFLALLRNPSSLLDGERDDRISVLLLGMGGAGHEGPLLADTILVASFSPSTGSAALISVPRDLLLPAGDDTFEKANAIHAYAEDRRRRGPEELAAALEDAFGLSIPSYVRVDFAGFVELVDALGGVTVDVERTLDDPLYPVTGREDAEDYATRYEHLVIPAGPQHFDGALALKYVRSRSAHGVEGSDFARGRRQQRLLGAIRDTIAAHGGLANPRQLLALVKTANRHLATNLTASDLIRLAALVRDVPFDAVEHIALTDDPTTGVLTAGRANGAYVLRPRGGAYSVLAQTIAHALAPDVAPAPPERLRVVILNGTGIAGLASQVAATLDAGQYAVLSVGNAPVQTIERTVVYAREVDDGDRSAAIDALVERLDATRTTTFPAVDVVATYNPDILIVLGAPAGASHASSPRAADAS